jgi:hypothetical protein
MNFPARCQGAAWPGGTAGTRLVAVYSIPESVVVQKVADEMVVLDLKSGRYFGLNPTGARMFELLKVHGQRDAVVRVVVEEYDAPAEQIVQDLDELIGQLEEHGLVRRAGA